MDALQVRRMRPERLIGLGRMVLAVFSLLAIWLDPSEPAKYVAATYALLAGYVAYAVVVLGAILAVEGFAVRAALATHAADLSVFSVVIYLTEGATSPFFVFFIFFLLAAALRWQWRGILWTALAALTLYVGVGVYAQEVLQDPAFELNRFIIRIVYLAVAAVLLGYLSAYEQQLRKELVDLAAWPRHVAPGSLVEAALRHVAGIFGAERLVMIWEETEEPWRHRAMLVRGAFERVRERVASTEALVADVLQEHDFLCVDLESARPTTLYVGADGTERWHGRPLAAGLQAHLASTRLLAVRIGGNGFDGRLFVLDRPRATTDDLTLGGIVARQIGADLDQFYLQERLQQAVVSEERIRFARELHDGVLQTLTGLRLHLRAAARLMDTDPHAARARLAELQDVVASEQSDLRFFVRRMKPVLLPGAAANANLSEQLETLGQRIERQWGLRVKLSAELLGRGIAEVVAHAVYRIVQEALVNATRHGAAKLARVRLDIQDERLRIVVADDGHGFPFHGRYDFAALEADHVGPLSIMQRVAALDGEIVIESAESGTRLEIELPLRPSPQVLTAADGLASDGGPTVWRRAE